MSAEQSMTVPEAVLKHDGRIMPFDLKRLEASLMRAAAEAAPVVSPRNASRLGHDVASAVAGAVLELSEHAVSTAEIRALAIKHLREAGYEGAASAYQNHARLAALLLWRVRVSAPEARRSTAAAHPWDRRKLLEALHASGIAPDTAGIAAREVERRIVALRQEVISPALVHALALLVLPREAEGVRAYSARRVAYCAALNLPHFSRTAAAAHPLPREGSALAQFWLQCVHTPEIVDAARGHLLALEPFPYSDEHDALDAAAVPEAPADPLGTPLAELLEKNSGGPRPRLTLNLDNAPRIKALAAQLQQLPEDTRAELELYFKTPPRQFFQASQRAGAITLNAGGLVAREGQRDLRRAAVRLAELAVLAAQAHREREDYFNRSPVRGRLLPVALAGLWNAAALLQGENFHEPRLGRPAFQAVERLCESVRDALAGVRELSGMDLLLTVRVPAAAAAQLWQGDSAFFARHGLILGGDGAYNDRFEIPLAPSFNDFNSRVDFIKQLGGLLDEPPAPQLEVPLQNGATSALWAELFQALSDSGISRAVLTFGGGVRALPALTQALRSYLDGFPLLDALAEGNQF